MIKLLFISTLLSTMSFGQSFAPPPGQIGSTALHKDSSVFINWATNVIVTRGPLDIENVSLGNATYGFDIDGVGVADGIEVVSLGDGGEAIITFDLPIKNGVGADFAIFENGFTDNYMEFAFVEVSSDGINFFRFESISETPTDTQLTNFSLSDCRYVYNLAGKYRQNFGTPFDLQELDGIIGLDINYITHVKLIDVIGNINPLFGTVDSQGTIINDPYPTIFESGGFDLDAVGVIHEQTLELDEVMIEVSVYPNPTSGVFYIQSEYELSYTLVDSKGITLLTGNGEGIINYDLSNFSSGIYLLRINNATDTSVIRISKIGY